MACYKSKPQPGVIFWWVQRNKARTWTVSYGPKRALLDPTWTNHMTLGWEPVWPGEPSDECRQIPVFHAHTVDPGVRCGMNFAWILNLSSGIGNIAPPFQWHCPTIYYGVAAHNGVSKSALPPVLVWGQGCACVEEGVTAQLQGVFITMYHTLLPLLCYWIFLFYIHME